jgi:hypothetical protein
MAKKDLPGLSRFLYLYKKPAKTRQSQSASHLREVLSVQLIPQRPEYPAGFAVYITLNGFKDAHSASSSNCRNRSFCLCSF